MLHFGNVIIPWDWGWGWGIVGVLVNVIIIAVIVRIIFRIIRGDRRRYWDCCRAEGEYAGSEAGKILDERYAKGEIDDEEYRKKKENLR